MKTRTATTEDFKIGTTLIMANGSSFTIIGKYDDKIWDARGTNGQGEKCVFEGEARFYQVAL